MEATLHALGNLLVESVPTIVFFVFLYFFLRQVFFRPLAAVLEERRKSTAGVKEIAERAFAEADKKQSEFERALELAREQIRAENEALRKQWAEEEARVLAEARADAERRREAARAEVAAEVQRAHQEMETRIDALTNSIVDTLLHRRAA
jgi:F-type H+-transporting ATPase subunit b